MDDFLMDKVFPAFIVVMILMATILFGGFIWQLFTAPEVTLPILPCSAYKDVSVSALPVRCLKEFPCGSPSKVPE